MQFQLLSQIQGLSSLRFRQLLGYFLSSIGYFYCGIMHIHRESKKSLGFTQRTYPARTAGLLLTGIAFAPVFMEIGQPLWVWLGFGFYILVWPHLCYLYCTIYNDSLETAKQLLTVDAFCCGLIVAAAHCALMPSAILMTMVALNNISTGGPRFMSLGLSVQALGVVSGVAMLGWEPRLQSSLLVNVASIPTLVVYPLIIGWLNYQFSLRIHHQKKQLEALSRTDGLTGLYNRRYWQLRAKEEFDRCQRYGQRAVLVMIDIDHFKNINDNFGHKVGDEAIQGVAEIIQKQLRRIDIIGRYGGEEFSLVLVDTDAETSKGVAERIRLAVQKEQLGDETPVHCTISLGLAAFDLSMENVDAWIGAADGALYEAKKRGRNCCCVHSSRKVLHVVAAPRPHSNDKDA